MRIFFNPKVCSNIFVTKSLKGQLDQVIIHEQVENGVP
jgi:hypothetical protein